MATKITDTEMASDQTRHTARAWPVPDEPTLWSVTWLPGRALTRDQAVTAMTIAEFAITHRGALGDVLSPAWSHLAAWADKIGITPERALALASASPEDHAADGAAVSAPDFSRGLEELAGLINFQVGAWHDFGYEVPPAPECKPVPPLGERSAEAIKAGHEAVKAIDDLTRQLYGLREQLVGELRQDEDLRAERVDAMLARLRQERQS
jgi:hypothetical protein